MSAPMLDQRTFDELLRELRRAAAETIPRWQPRHRVTEIPLDRGESLALSDDPAAALAVIYTHYLEILLERLNRVPDKNLLAFLDLLGVGLLPPSVASVPVAFSLAPSSGTAGFVPAGTQVATAQTETAPAVIYETSTDLTVVAARLSAALAIDPIADRYTDATGIVTGQEQFVFDPFRGDRQIEHILHVGSDLLRMSAPGDLVLQMRFVPPPELDQELAELLAHELTTAVAWDVSRDGGWRRLVEPAVDIVVTNGEITVRFAVPEALGADLLTLSRPGLASPRTTRWLRGRLTQAIHGLKLRELQVTETSLAVGVPTFPVGDEGTLAVLPDHVHVNEAPVDFSRPFRPLGDMPTIGSTFNVASAEALGMTTSVGDRGLGGSVHLDIEVPAATLVWEVARGVLGDRGQGGLSWHEALRDDTTLGLTQDGTITLVPSDDFSLPEEWGDETRGWLYRVRIIDGAFPSSPVLQNLWLTIGFNGGVETYDVEYGFISDRPIDQLPASPADWPDAGLTRIRTRGGNIVPFGPDPTIGRTFTFILGRSMDPMLPEEIPIVLRPYTARLTWEYLAANGWKLLGESSTTEVSRGEDASFLDATLALRRTGRVAFVRPKDFAAGAVNGVTGFWIRARLDSGDYGRPAEYVPVDETDPKTGFRLRAGTGVVAAPVVKRITLGYDAVNQWPLVVTANAFRAADRTGSTVPYPPFEPVDDLQPTFYLGFDRSLPNELASLYFAVPPRQIVERISEPAGEETGGDERTELIWEFASDLGWETLPVADGTSLLTESGFVRFIGPPRMALLDVYDGTPRAWVRVRRQQAEADHAPMLSGVFLNTALAFQMATVPREILGSSSGRLRQGFAVARPPVLPGQRLLVREPERPPADEEALLQREEGAGGAEGRDLVTPAVGPDDSSGFLVRWHEVGSLARSGPRSRHYTVDRIVGLIGFGDGVQGMVPPEGRDNLLLTYRSGGGAAGNQPPAAINQLKTSIPYVATVANPIAADGGAPAETIEGVMRRGPQTLKHRGRAVTAGDFDWLVRQAVGTRVAVAHVMPNRNRELEPEPGWVTVVVVPRGAPGEKKLLPSTELIRETEDDLAARSLATIVGQNPAQINVVGPGYLPVELAVEVVAIDAARAGEVRRAVQAALDAFLHPLIGGPDGAGWAFGRDVYLSELYAALESLPGIEHVDRMRFLPTAATNPLVIEGLTAQPHDAGDSVMVVRDDGTSFSARLAEAVPAGRDTMTITLFREGERIRIVNGDDASFTREVTVRGISGSVLTVDPFRAQANFPSGSEVASVDGASRSFLSVPLAKDTLVERIAIWGFEPLTDQEPKPLRLTFADPTESLALMRDDDGALVLGERLRVPDASLPYSGEHRVEIELA